MLWIHPVLGPPGEHRTHLPSELAPVSIHRLLSVIGWGCFEAINSPALPAGPWHRLAHLGTARSPLGRSVTGAWRRNWRAWQQPVPRRCGQRTESAGLSVCVCVCVLGLGKGPAGRGCHHAGTGELHQVR